ncbi:hypothetical protein HY024_02290 [Candidatus Curtissbacteria bacterium]|nr:hypothetical protein [Candidatus Curtissbacteria bacterium]
MIKSVFRFLQFWIPLAIAITALSALVYITVHQNYRQSANDPQIQIARDTVVYLEKGYSAQAMVPASNLVDMSKSLAPYVIVYDDSGKVVAASVELSGKTPEVPSGVFEEARKRGELHFTWQPKVGVRSAVVLASYGAADKHGFVLVGRSLAEVENRTFMLAVTVALAWVVTMGATFVATFVLFFVPSIAPFGKTKKK